MELTLKRINFAKGYTTGKLYVDGQYFCDTLEDTVRNLPTEAKVAGETAIPAGTYKVIVNRSPRFGRYLPRLIDVPYFTGILIHRGNTAKDTAGCILVGKDAGNGTLVHSTPIEVSLTNTLKREQEIGNDITIKIA